MSNHSVDSKLDGDRVTSRKDLVYKATDLQDHESIAVGKIAYACHLKYSTRRATAENLEQYRDELLTRLAEIGVLATFDPTPLLFGDYPILDIVGKVGGLPHGFDHEQKEYEVKQAAKRNEEYRGQKERNSAEKKGLDG